MDEQGFRDYLSRYGDAEKILGTQLRDTIRINALKTDLKSFRDSSTLALEPTFYDMGFYADAGEVKLGSTWEYFLGYMHTQTLSSMVPSLVLAPNARDLVLDAAASPGSKTSHLAMIMGNKGAIMANDVSYDRSAVLFSNITRLGVLNTKVTVRDATKLDIKGYFTKALVDAPCSSLSQPYAFKKFNLNFAKKIANDQARMLIACYDSLLPGGALVYSTCTYEAMENEENVRFLLEQRPGASIVDLGLEFPHDPGLSEYGHEFRKVGRIYPYHFGSEGFFVAKITKAIA